MKTLFRQVTVAGRECDVLIGPGSIESVGPALEDNGVDEVVNGRGAALLPGLHDHHIHLMACAAVRTSVDCGNGLDALRNAPEGKWVRGVNATVSVDRHVLDQLVPDRPVRVQHSSGGLWMLNSKGLQAVADALVGPDVELDANGEPTGRLWRFDTRLRQALPSHDELSAELSAVVQEVHSFGVTSVTDATPDLDRTAVDCLSGLPLGVTLLGDPAGGAPWKIMLRDHDLPDFATLTGWIAGAHSRNRPVAVHCVTRESLLLTLAALDEAGRVAGDRIEHAGVVPAEARSRLRGLLVITQPAMLTSRAERFTREVDPDDLNCLYPHASLLDAGVRVFVSSDAPYGPINPWAVLRSARDRDLAPLERVPVDISIRGLFTDSRGRQRSIAPGEPSAVCLLHVPWDRMRVALEDGAVRLVRDYTGREPVVHGD